MRSPSRVFVTIILPGLFLGVSKAASSSAEEYLAQGNDWLSEGDADRAVGAYRRGLEELILLRREPDPASSAPPRGRGQLVTEMSLHTNLATALSSQGRDGDAIEPYRRAVAAYRNYRAEDAAAGEEKEGAEADEAALIAAQASFYLGMVLQDSASSDGGGGGGGAGARVDASAVREAIEAYRYALELDPAHWSAAANLGSMYHDALLDHGQALDAYGAAYSILTEGPDPTDPPGEPRRVLADLQYRIGLCLSHDPTRRCRVVADERSASVPPSDDLADCRELAANAFARAVEYDPANEAAKHMLATLTADATVKRASNEYVAQLFDEYAKNFEHSLVRDLGYNGYERLRRAFDRAFGGNPPQFSLVLDAGCGTGLVGSEFRNVSSTLIGVDLSQAIIDQAKKQRPTLYNETIAGDVTDVLRERRGTIKLVVAADSFIYFGDLDPLFDAIDQGLAYGGFVAFTLEDVDAESEQTLASSKPDWRWQLTATGRFAHRREYVASVGKSYNLQLIHYERIDGFRHERGVEVRGHIFILRKGRPDQEL